MNGKKISDYKAVILAGGKGTRLYPVTLEMAKILLPLGKKPMINHLVDLLLFFGVNEIIILTNEKFKEDFVWWKKRYYFNKNNISIFSEKKPMGTFGGVLLLKQKLKSSPFFLINGDVPSTINLKKMSLFYKKNNSLVTVGVYKVKDSKDYGVVKFEKNKIIDFCEKPDHLVSDYINAGWYLFSPKIFDYYKKPKFYMSETDVFPKLAKQGQLFGFKFSGKWIDCGTWERYEKAQKIFNKL